MLQEKVQADLINSMKHNDAVGKEVYSFLLSKIRNKAIELHAQDNGISDVEVVAIIQKMLKELDEEVKMYRSAGRLDTVKVKELQTSILLSYLPKMLSDIEIKAEIDTLADKTMPSIMKHFKTNFAGRVDMGLVSKIAREIK